MTAAATGREVVGAVQVVIGVDTHQDEHVAVAIDQQGVRLAERHEPATSYGYGELERWSRYLGEVRAFGVEGTGSYGAGLARFLTGRGFTVLEVNRPDRSVRYRKGKSDPTDAEMAAARAVLAGVANATPKSGDGEVEMIRMLKSAKDSAVKARTQAFNQMKALIVTAPAELRETLGRLTTAALVTRCKNFRPGGMDGPMAAAKCALRSLARRYRQLGKERKDLETELERLTRTISPALVESFGIGPDTAATLLIAAGSNPDRLHSEAAFASLCGVNPIPASSGKTNRHRLNRGGHRQANAALHRIVVVRLRHDDRTKEYMHRRTAEGMSKAEVIRCLKRYVAREVFSVLRNSPGIVRRTIAKLAREVYKGKVGKRDGRCVDMEAKESLFECLEQVPDPRMARGVRHPFQAILRLTLLGLVCGQTTMAHIALFARMNWPALKEPLGFLRDHPPHATTISRGPGGGLA